MLQSQISLPKKFLGGQSQALQDWWILQVKSYEHLNEN